MFDIPCKKCLVQATCKQRCDEFNEYSFLLARLKSIFAGVLAVSGFGIATSTINHNLTFMILFLILAIIASIFMGKVIRKETKYYILADEFMMYESPIFKKHGIKFPMSRRVR